MDTRPDYDLLDETAKSQASYLTAVQARKVGFSWERLSSNASVGRFRRVARAIIAAPAAAAIVASVYASAGPRG